MSNVFVVDTKKHPLHPVHPGRARVLLNSQEAAVYTRYPFTIILKKALAHPQVHPLRLKIDPGSTTTGLAIVKASPIAIALLYTNVTATVMGMGIPSPTPRKECLFPPHVEKYRGIQRRRSDEFFDN